MFRTQGDYAAWAQRRMNDNATVQRDADASRGRDALVDACERGLVGSMQATPDLFAAFVFESRSGAEVLATWILAQPRRARE